MAGINKFYTASFDKQEVIPVKVVRLDGSIETRAIPVEQFGKLLRKREGEKLTNHYKKEVNENG